MEMEKRGLARFRSQEKDFYRRGRTDAFKEKQENNKKRKKKSGILEQECKGLSTVKLVSYMEKQKSILRKLKRGFLRSKKQEEARFLNQQFQTNASRVYANTREMLN